jgi:hypothetical protein
MTFLELTKYYENVPEDPLEKYLFDIEQLVKEDERVLDCYVMDVDFLIFYKKLNTVSSDLNYTVTITCSHCGNTVKKKINLEKDIHFKGIDPKVMNGAFITLNGHKYETQVPTVRDFLKVFEVYLRVKKINDLKMIKTISLIKDFEYQGNQIEDDVLGATHEDITLLMAFRDLYFDRVEPIEVICGKCKDENGERRRLTVSVDSLIVDFFRELYVNCPIDASKVIFK